MIGEIRVHAEEKRSGASQYEPNAYSVSILATQVDVSDAQTTQHLIAQLFERCKAGIREQMQRDGLLPSSPPDGDAPGTPRSHPGGNGNRRPTQHGDRPRRNPSGGNGSGAQARTERQGQSLTTKQRNYALALARDLQLPGSDLDALCQRMFRGVQRLSDLSKAQAGSLLDTLQAAQRGEVDLKATAMAPSQEIQP